MRPPTVIPPKRKLSGPVNTLSPKSLSQSDPSQNNTLVHIYMPVQIPTINRKPLAPHSPHPLFLRSITTKLSYSTALHLDEVARFIFFLLNTILILILALSDWVFFFKYVVDAEFILDRLKWATIWVIATFGLYHFRQLIRNRSDHHSRLVADHIEIFVITSLVMVFSANIAFYFHIPSMTPLHDLGFMVIPEQGIESAYRPLSDILTSVVPVLFLLQTAVLSRETRSRIISSFFRVASICYFLRMCTIFVTSLPGPAPHCRPGSSQYHPPQNWVDIVTFIGPIYGNYRSCGDLIFSGHMAFSTTAVLLYLRVLDRYRPKYRFIRWMFGIFFLTVLAALCLAGRKHYTVDVVLGVIMATLVFFHFEHGWIPLCWQISAAHMYEILEAQRKDGQKSYYHSAQELYEESDEILNRQSERMV